MRARCLPPYIYIGSFCHVEDYILYPHNSEELADTERDNHRDHSAYYAHDTASLLELYSEVVHSHRAQALHGALRLFGRDDYFFGAGRG